MVAKMLLGLHLMMIVYSGVAVMQGQISVLTAISSCFLPLSILFSYTFFLEKIPYQRWILLAGACVHMVYFTSVIVDQSSSLWFFSDATSLYSMITITTLIGNLYLTKEQQQKIEEEQCEVIEV
ncbi:MAG: hypothetical protein NZL83_02140 [Candidatus Absconditabacterales bacterium]|nr:hypothetical protein [Candidatus Absconditabacterales bacterium]